MTEIDKQFEVVVFQTNLSGSQVLVVDGRFLPDDNPIRNNPALAFMNDLGNRGFQFKSQIEVSTFTGMEKRVQWVFERTTIT